MVDTELNIPEDYEAVWFTWDENMISKKLELSHDRLSVNVLEESTFKSVLGNVAFTPGKRYYYEIYLENASLVKIGVARKETNVEIAFSDTEQGWAIYNGELRHASNTAGTKYGSAMKTGDTIGVMLDMIEGKLSFTRNGEQLGVAFHSEELAKGEFYAACSPVYSSDKLTLKMQKED